MALRICSAGGQATFASRSKSGRRLGRDVHPRSRWRVADHFRSSLCGRSSHDFAASTRPRYASLPHIMKAKKEAVDKKDRPLNSASTQHPRFEVDQGPRNQGGPQGRRPRSLSVAGRNWADKHQRNESRTCCKRGGKEKGSYMAIFVIISRHDTPRCRPRTPKAGFAAARNRVATSTFLVAGQNAKP